MSSELRTPALAAVEVRGLTREAFLARATFAAGAIYGLRAVGPFAREAFAQSRQAQDRQEAVGDLRILNFALTLTLVEQSLYSEARDRAPLGGRTRAIVDQLARDEDAHVTELRKVVRALRGAPVAPPEPDFGAAVAGRGSFLALAEKVEETTVFALNGLSPQAASKSVRERVAALAQVDARHAALIRLVRGADPAPKAFEDTLTVPQAREQLAPYVPIFR